VTRVPDWSEQEFEDRSFKLAALIRRAWRAVARLVAGQLESKPVITAADAGSIPDAWNVEAEAELLGYLTDTYLDAAGKVRAAVDAPDDFLLADDLVAAYLRSARNRLRHIGDEVWQEVSAQLLQGVSAGESIPELATRVKNTAGVSDARSLTIARTEVHAAHEAGSYDQALFVDPDAVKIWLATEDARTRETHRAADGQRRRLNEPFEVGGGQLRYPGDPLGPADEIINCRCTTVYDFGTLDSVTSDEPELALVAASKKKWTPAKHPRGADGRFIKKGAVVDLLSKPKPNLLTVTDAVSALDKKTWDKLTEAQQDYFLDSVAKLPKGSAMEQQASKKLADLGITEATPAPAAPAASEAPAVPKAKVLAQAAPPTNKAAKTILETDDFAQLGNQKYKKPLGKTGKPLRVGFLGDDGSITAHVGSKPGDPAKVSTFLIWGKYPPGTTILESADGKDSVVWNGKKFDFRTDGQTTKTLGKQDTYDTLHSQAGWKVPKYEGQPVDQPGVLTELVEGYQEPDDEVDTDSPDPVPTPEPTPTVEPEPVTPEVPEVPDVAPEPESEPVSVPEAQPEPEPESEPDVLQQLMDGTYEDPLVKALHKLSTQGSITDVDAVQIALGLTQSEWNGLTAEQRSKITLGTDKALDNEQIDSQDAWLAFNKISEFQANQTAPAPAPSSVMKIDLPPAPPAAPGVITDEGEWVAIAAHDFWPAGAVVAETTDGEFKLTKGFAPNTWYLKDYNNETITSYTDADVEAGQAQAENPFHDWKASPFPEAPVAPEPELEPVATEEPAEPDTTTIDNETDWLDLIDTYANVVDTPTVVAESENGTYRMVVHPDGAVSLEWNTAGKWIDLETFDPNALADFATVDDLMQSHTSSAWHKVDPVPTAVPTSSTPPSPVLPEKTPTLALPDTTWTLSTNKPKSDVDAYTNFVHPAGTILGITPDAKMQAVSTDSGSYVLQMVDADGNWFDGAVVSPNTLALMFKENTWTLPDSTFEKAVSPAPSVQVMPPAQPGVEPWKLVPANDPPEGTIYEPIEGYFGVVDQYVNFDHPAGTVIALRNLEGVNIRVVATGLDDPAYKMQIQSLSTKQWYDNASGAVTAEQAIQQLKKGNWLLPQSALLPAMGNQQQQQAPEADVPSVAPAPAAPTSTLGGDTSMIPLSSKKAWKKKLSAAKVAYYSKPEKIWDQIKQIQDAHPDPLNPGHSKLTPLQVIKSLDEVYSGKLDSPYESKMVPWAATPKGMAYTSNPGVPQVSTPNTPAASQMEAQPAPTPMVKTPENIEKLFIALQDMEPGTVLATNIGDGSNQFQIVVAPMGGAKVPQMQYKQPGAATWKDSVSFPTAVGFEQALSIEFNNQPWQMAVVQLPNGGIASATAPTPETSSGPAMKSMSKTMASVSDVWAQLSEVPDDTVLATNPGGVNQYRMVVKSDSLGLKYVVVESKKNQNPDDPWQDTKIGDITDVTTLHVTLQSTLGSNEWKFFGPASPLTPPTFAGPPPPKLFKSSVKSIYAAMPALKPGQFMATAEVDGVKYGLVVGYGYTKSWKQSTKKKLILKKQMPSGGWATVEQMDTQVKLGQVLKDPKYAWIEAEEMPATPPPSVSSPVSAPKPAPKSPTSESMTYAATSEGIEDLWNHLDEMGDGVTIATTTVFGDLITLKSSIKGGNNSIIEVSSDGTKTVASSAEELKKVLAGADWSIKASKSPLFGASDIANLSEDKKQDLYKKFKGQPSTYLDSPTSSIYGALSYIANENGVTLLQMIRVVDDIGAKKVNKPDEHLFEKKIKDWLKTPQGVAVALGKPIPLPDNPDFLPSVDPKKIMPLEQSDKLSYQIISVDKAKKLNAEFKAASPAGKWTAAQEHGLSIYTGGTYISINNYYRGKTDDISAANEKAARETQQAMRPSTVPMLLHRGVGYDGVGGANSHADILKRVGQTWQAGGFFSTSAGGAAAFGGPVLIEVEAPPGTPMTFVDSPSDVSSSNCVSSNCGEREMLLGAGLHYKILSVKYEGGKSVVRLRVVPTPDDEGE
jgi:hypothetical protein